MSCIRYIRSYIIDFLCMQFSRYIRLLAKPSGEYESRTRDLLLARQALSQLS